MNGTLQRNRVTHLLPAGFPEVDTLFSHFFRPDEVRHVACAGFDLGSGERVPHRDGRSGRRRRKT